MRREAVGAAQLAAAADEQLGDLDDVPLHPAGHRGDLPHGASTVALEGGVHDEVDRGCHGRHDEARRHVLAREQGQGAHLGDGLPGAVRVDRAHAGQRK